MFNKGNGNKLCDVGHYEVNIHKFVRYLYKDNSKNSIV